MIIDNDRVYRVGITCDYCHYDGETEMTGKAYKRMERGLMYITHNCPNHGFWFWRKTRYRFSFIGEFENGCYRNG